MILRIFALNPHFWLNWHTSADQLLMLHSSKNLHLMRLNVFQKENSCIVLLKRIIETFAVRKSEKYAAAFNHSRAEFETFQFFIFRKKGRIHYFQCKILATVPMPSSGIVNPLFMLVSMFQNIGIIASFTKYQ